MLNFLKPRLLTPAQLVIWTKLTGLTPTRVKTFAQLDTFVQRCKRRYADGSWEAHMLADQIDEEHARCIEEIKQRARMVRNEQRGRHA